MDYLDYIQLNFFQKVAYKVSRFFKKIPTALKTFFLTIGRAIAKFFMGIVHGFKNFGVRFAKGGIFTKLSYFIMGIGNITHKQIGKGLCFLAVQIGYLYYMISFGAAWLKDLPTLGTQASQEVWDEVRQMYVYHEGDNSMLILLYGVLTIIISVVFIALYVANTKSAYATEQMVKEGKTPSSFKKDMQDLLDSKFHITLLSLPTLLVCAFTVLPLIFMILIAFTNFDSYHQAGLFDWVGLENFKNIFYQNAKYVQTFGTLTKWTLTWAVCATFSNYILGMIVALMINKKGIKFKSVYRTMFVLAIAVPQFVTLLLMKQMLHKEGIINVVLMELGLIDKGIDFLGTALGAKISVIVVNMWIGIPYTILITSGILMNIPEELYESAKIDGASPFKTFTKITLPYMLFVTTPYLITQFVGNINNFNLIYLLTGGDPKSLDLYKAGQTDLLVTWLYKLTVNENDNNLAATIGILVFILCAGISLITFNSSKSAKNEEEFS
ncbi:MAG: carbohydrate ABC transporter permease [Acutalibacteraceae bacterium]